MRARGGAPLTRGSADLRELLLHDVRGERQIAVLDDDRLPFLAEDELEELANQRIGRFVGRLIDVEEEEAIEYRLAIEEGKLYKPYHRKMSDKSQLAVWCIQNNKEVFINDIEISSKLPVYVVKLAKIQSCPFEIIV